MMHAKASPRTFERLSKEQEKIINFFKKELGLDIEEIDYSIRAGECFDLIRIDIKAGGSWS